MKKLICILLILVFATPAGANDLINTGHEVVTRDLKDPGSAQFRSDFVNHRLAPLVICGEINAKNSYGAYVGFRRYYVSAGTSEIRNEGNDEGFDVMWDFLCGR